MPERTPSTPVTWSPHFRSNVLCCDSRERSRPLVLGVLPEVCGCNVVALVRVQREHELTELRRLSANERSDACGVFVGREYRKRSRRTDIHLLVGRQQTRSTSGHRTRRFRCLSFSSHGAHAALSALTHTDPLALNNPNGRHRPANMERERRNHVVFGLVSTVESQAIASPSCCQKATADTAARGVRRVAT